MKNIIQKICPPIIAFILSSCSNDDNQFNGSGNIIMEERIVGNFDKIISSSSINVSVVYGSAQNITVSADDNIIDRINITIINGRLKISLYPGNYISITASVTITIPIFSEIENTGSGNTISTDFIDLDDVSFINSGSGSIIAKGTATKMSVINSGSGSFKGFGFITENSTISSSGSGSCELFSNNTLTGVLSGSGNVLYKGTAAVTITDSGSGNVINSN